MSPRNSSWNTSHVAGYLRQEPVAGPGEFSVRGGIVDVFSPLMRSPVRMEFFGDTVDSIREFDLDDQRSRGPVQHIDILPMQDVLVSREMIRQWAAKARAITGRMMCFQKELSRKTRLRRRRRVISRRHVPLAARVPAGVHDLRLRGRRRCSFLMNRKSSTRTHEKFLESLQQRYEQTVAAGGLALPPANLFCVARRPRPRPKLQNPAPAS